MSPRAVTLLAISYAFTSRIHHLAYQSFWRDEIDAVELARRDLPSLLLMFRQVGENGPLYFLALHPWIGLVGSSDLAVRFFSLGAGVLAVPVLAALGARLFDRWTGAAAAALLAANPYALWYSQDAKMYAWVCLIAALSFWLLLRAERSGRWLSWLGWAVCLAAGIYVHFVFAVVAGAEVVVVAGLALAGSPGARRGSLLIAALALLDLPLARWQVPLLLGGLSTSYPFVPLDQIVTQLLGQFTFGVNPPTTGGLLLFGALLLGGLALGAAPRPRRAHLLVLGWLALPVLGLFLVSLRIPLFLDRYLTGVLPAYVLGLAAGARAIGHRSMVLLAGVLVAVALVWLPVEWKQPLVKQDFKRSASYLDQHLTPNDTVVFLPSWERTYFDYYHVPTVPYRSLAIPTVDVSGLPAVSHVVGGTLESSSDLLWLVSVEPAYGDRGLQLQHWLDDHAQLLTTVQFANLELRHYQGPIH
jgi:hypothetical protein